jgi:hypothetical protein
MKNLLIISFAALLLAASLSAPAQTVGTIGTSTSEALTNKTVSCASNKLSGLQSACTVVDVMNSAYAGGAKCDGHADDTATIQAAINSLSSGYGTVQLPAGKKCKITSTITVSQPFVHIVGGLGMPSTKIDFEPTANGSAFKFSAGATVLYNDSISGICIQSSDTTHTKTAIELSDTSAFTLQDVLIGCGGIAWTGGSAVSPDTKNGSIGIRYRGREINDTSRIMVNADRPIVVSANPNAGGAEVLDHDHFWDLYLLQSGSNIGPLIWVDDGVVLSNTTFDGYEAWVHGTYGFYWNDTTSTIASQNVSIKNARWEQISGSSGYQVYINMNRTLNQLLLENLSGGLGANGYYLRNVNDFTFTNVFYVGALVGLDADSTNSYGIFNDLHINNPTATVNLTATRITGTYFTGGTVHSIQPTTPPSGGGTIQQWDPSLTLGITQFEPAQFTVAPWQAISFATSAMSGLLNLYTNALPGAAIYIVGGSNHSTALIASAPGGWFGTTASATKINLFWKGATTISGVSITGNGGQFSCTCANLVVGQHVTISGATGLITPYSNPTPYVVKETNGTSTFTLQTLGLAAISTTMGSPSLTYTPNIAGASYVLQHNWAGSAPYSATLTGVGER